MMFGFNNSANGGMAYDDPTDVDTEVRILRSDLLALQVIKQLNLDKRPEFGGSGSVSTNSLGLTTDSLQLDSAATSRLLSGFQVQPDGVGHSRHAHYRDPLS